MKDKSTERLSTDTSTTLAFNPFTGPEHQGFVLDGGQPAVLLIHGFPGTPHEMRPLAEALHAWGWTAQALLLPGFGPELDLLPTMRLADWTQAVRDAAHALRRSHRPFVVIGFSMGGSLALATASELQPDALILLSPFTGLQTRLWQWLPLFRRLVPRLRPFRLFKPNFSDPRFRQGMEGFLPGVDWDDPAAQAAMRDFTVPVAVLDEVRKAGNTALQAVAEATMPALILQGREDPIVPPKQTRQLLSLYSGPHCYAELDGAHDLPDPEGTGWPQVTSAIRRFLQGQLGIAPEHTEMC